MELHYDEPYIQASQAQLVYYVEDNKDNGWCTLVHLKPRDLFDMGDDGTMTTYESKPHHQHLTSFLSNDIYEIV